MRQPPSDFVKRLLRLVEREDTELVPAQEAASEGF
jgi:hypothetical protein